MRSRSAFQLLELVVATSIAAMLLAGLGSSVLIANRSLKSASDNYVAEDQSTGFDRLWVDVSEAHEIDAVSATEFSLTVSDRDGNSSRDELFYRWAGADNPLELSYDNSNWTPLTGSLTDFAFNPTHSKPASVAPDLPFHPPGLFVFQQRMAGLTLLPGSGLIFTVPAGYRSGDLLVISVISSADQGGATAISGWDKIFEYTSPANLTLSAWYTFAPPSNVVTVSWPNVASGFAMGGCFEPPTTTSSLGSYLTFEDKDVNAACPALGAVDGNALILRFAGGAGQLTGSDQANMANHLILGAEQLDKAYPFMAAAFQVTHYATDSGATFFNVSKNSNYVSATITFNP